MTQQTTEEILLEYGVHIGYGQDRKELARQLESQIPEAELEKTGLGGMDVGGGLKGLDLKMVCDHIKDTGAKKNLGARIATVLSDRNLWGPMLSDLRQFHRHRLDREAKTGKRKIEPGKGLRDQDKDKMVSGTAEFFGLTQGEYDTFKWRWCVADWRHGGHNPESVEKFMGATPEEQADCLERFPKKHTFDEALAGYVKGVR